MYELPDECFVLQKTAAFRAPKVKPPKVNPVRPRPAPKPTIGGAISGLASRVPGGKPLAYGGAAGGGMYGLGQYLSGLVSDAQTNATPTGPQDAESQAAALEERRRRLNLGQ